MSSPVGSTAHGRPGHYPPEKYQMAREEVKKRKEAHKDGKIVTAFTPADDDRWLPPCFVVGALAVRHGPGFDSYEVGGAFVDGTTIKPILNPTPELIKQLKE